MNTKVVPTDGDGSPRSTRSAGSTVGDQAPEPASPRTSSAAMESLLRDASEGKQVPGQFPPPQLSSLGDMDSLVQDASDWANDVHASHSTGPRSLPNRPRTHGRERARRGSVAVGGGPAAAGGSTGSTGSTSRSGAAAGEMSAEDLAALAVAEMDSLMEEEAAGSESEGTATPHVVSDGMVTPRAASSEAAKAVSPRPNLYLLVLH